MSNRLISQGATPEELDAEAAAIAARRAEIQQQRLERGDRQVAAVRDFCDARLERFRDENRVAEIDEAYARFVHAVRTGTGGEWLQAWREYRITRVVIESTRQQLEAAVATAHNRPRTEQVADLRMDESFDKAVSAVLAQVANETAVSARLARDAEVNDVRAAVE